MNTILIIVVALYVINRELTIGDLKQQNKFNKKYFNGKYY